MYTLYTAATPNGHKISIALEELNVTYKVQALRLGEGDQRQPEYLRINPNGRIPALVDHSAGDFAIFESGAILHYLADKHGALMPPATDPKGRSLALQWLCFQLAGVGPMMGQAGVFFRYAEEKIPFAVQRYQNETKRLFGVLDQRLSESPYLAGDYSIADIATYPWIRGADWVGVSTTPYPHLEAWLEKIGARPAVQRGLTVPTDASSDSDREAEARKLLVT